MAAFTSVKPRLTLWFLALLACPLILLNTNQYVLVISMLPIAAYLSSHLTRRVRTAFQPVSVFQRSNRILRAQWDAIKVNMFQKNIDALPQYAQNPQEYKQKRFESLWMLLLFNRVFLRVSHQLKLIHESKVMIGYFVATILYTSLVALIAFAFEYYALAKIDPRSFEGYTGQGIWFFLYFSFNTIVRAGSGTFSALSPIARTLTVAEVAVGLFIGGILAWLIVTVFLERYNDEVKKVVDGLMREGQALEQMVTEAHRLSFQDAVAEIRHVNKTTADFIVWLTVTEGS